MHTTERILQDSNITIHQHGVCDLPQYNMVRPGMLEPIVPQEYAKSNYVAQGRTPWGSTTWASK